VKKHGSYTIPSTLHRLLSLFFVAIIPFLYTLPAPSAAAQPGFADKAFQQIWERTDAPVLSGQVQRSWYWGPQPGNTLNEPYSGGKGGARLVQYFDKARMEINNPDGDRSSQWFVTTGLLVVDMVSAKQQVGDKEFVPRPAAEIALGGDGLSTDPEAPTYTSFKPVSSVPGSDPNRAPNRVGQPVTATINRAGQVGNNPALGAYSGVTLAAYNDVLGHNIPQAMWDFLNLKGVVQQGGKLVNGQTLADWVFVMGYPISEPYWARVKIGGVQYDVLFQLFQRRSLAYIPAFKQGWQVQMGNVGQHYHRWLYGGPLPAPLVPTATPPARSTDIPAPVDATISPTTAAIGTPLTISITGFKPGEEIVSWFTAPDGKVIDARINLKAGADGTVKNISVPTSGLSPGLWSITFYGTASNHTSKAYFSLYTAPPTAVPSTPTRPRATSTPPPVAATATRTRPPAQGSVTPAPTMPSVPTQPAAGLVLSVRPGYGPPDAQFTFSASGLTAGEQVQVKFTDPGGGIHYPANSNGGRYTAGGDGRLSIVIVPSQAFAEAPVGVWLFELKGERSGLEGVIGFVIR